MAEARATATGVGRVLVAVYGIFALSATARAAVQIAGLVARRIICSTHAGAKVSLGETYGLIRFGSHLDTYFPEGSRVLVEIGQRAIAKRCGGRFW